MRSKRSIPYQRPLKHIRKLLKLEAKYGIISISLGTRVVNINRNVYSRAVKGLIEELRFLPLRERSRKAAGEDRIRFIKKSSNRGTCVVELIDGDKLSFETKEEFSELILHHVDIQTIDPLNFYIHIYIFSEFKGDFSEFNELLQQKYAEEASDFKNFSFILLDSGKKNISDVGLVSPYFLVKGFLKECLKDVGNAVSLDLPAIQLDCEKSTVMFDGYDNYNSFTHILAFFYLFYILILIVTSLWAGVFLKLWGKSFNSSFLPFWHDSDLLTIIANVLALLLITQLVEINYNVRKFLLITFIGGLIGGIPLYFFYGCFYNWVLPSCGALLYIHFRTKSTFSGHRVVIFALYSYLIFTAVLIYARDGKYGFTSFGGLAAGFFISGIIHFQEEFVDKSLEKKMWIGLGITIFVLFLVRVWFGMIM